MKKLLFKTLIATALAGCVTLSAQAQTAVKIGTVDLRKVFDGYYKTKLADAGLKEEAGDLEKQRKEMAEKFEKGKADYAKLLEKSNDQAVAAAERDKSKQTAEQKLLELRELDKTLKDFETSARAKLGEKQRRKRDQILQEIRELISVKAKAQALTVVIDTASDSISNTPVVIYSNGENDITDVVLKELNANAPATPIVAPAPAPAATPAAPAKK